MGDIPSSGPPPSRLSKMQIVAFLPPELDEAMRFRARSAGDTLQQVLGRAINRELKERGIPAVLTIERLHQFIRKNNPAQPRVSMTTAPTRRKRKCLAGWFDRQEVNKLQAICSEIGTDSQELAEAGARRLVSEPLETAV